MKVTLNWLKQYVDFNWSPEELAERLTMLGLEVEGVQKLGGEFDGIVVAQVITRDKHPNADKLSLCRVNDGQSERQIVCGAQNFKAGDKVPLIRPGASLPMKPGDKEPFTIKVGKIRGVESHGMLCSPKELGLAEEADGLLILRDDAPVGQPFAEYLGRAGGDVVYDLEITPNRPDWNSVIGIAREIAALTGNPLRVPEVRSQKSEVGTETLVAVRIEDAELCPRYTARWVQGVKVGPSPDWLRSMLEKVGLRSINNVVDVTNYVMLETGQPLHAFDYHLIAKAGVGQASNLSQSEGRHAGDRQDACPTIVVRRAAAGEKFKTLDGQERTLTSEMLLIADEQKGIALAGVMGGANTEINERTTDVLIESAYFAPTNIRRTSKALGLRSESSYRFERGCDPGIADYASQRCAQLILETAGGQLADGVVDAYPKPVEPRQIMLRHHKVNELLGLNLRPEEIEFHLGALGLKVANRKVRPVGESAPPEPVTFRIPTFRVDLKREVDLIEEVARLHGVDKIPSTPPRGVIGANESDEVYDEIADVRRALAGLGLDEAQGQTLIGKSEVRSQKSEEMVALANPLSADMDVLRPSLLPGLLTILRHNVSRKNGDLALFEIGRVFTNVNGQVKEERRVAMALTGKRYPAYWNGFLSHVSVEDWESYRQAAGQDYRLAKFDLFDLKGILEELFSGIGLRGFSFSIRERPTRLFCESATVALGGKLQLGEIGRVNPIIERHYDLRDGVFLAELRLDELLARRIAAKSFKLLPAFPAIRRDVAMFLPVATTHDAVLHAVKQAKAANLESVELFDVFRGEGVPEGQKSLAYAFTYRAADRTLTDAEVNVAHDRLVEHLQRQLQAEVRQA